MPAAVLPRGLHRRPALIGTALGGRKRTPRSMGAPSGSERAYCSRSQSAEDTTRRTALTESRLTLEKRSVGHFCRVARESGLLERGRERRRVVWGGGPCAVWSEATSLSQPPPRSSPPPVTEAPSPWMSVRGAAGALQFGPPFCFLIIAIRGGTERFRCEGLREEDPLRTLDYWSFPHHPLTTPASWLAAHWPEFLWVFMSMLWCSFFLCSMPVPSCLCVPDLPLCLVCHHLSMCFSHREAMAAISNDHW